MVQVAQVIVDVPTRQTDQPFSYSIPERFSELIQVGIRVAVPFGNGNRQIQGFVVALSEQEADSRLKEISDVLDLSPILSPEMIQLANEMAERFYAFKITCLQTMLPSVMRSTYEKKIVLCGEVPDHIKDSLFSNTSEVDWEEVKASAYFAELMKLKHTHQVDVVYQVKTRNRAKMIQMVQSSLSSEAIETERQKLRKNAEQQFYLLDILPQLEEPVAVSQIVEDTGISQATLKTGAKKGWLIFSKAEIYRDPHRHQHFPASQPLSLNSEQEQAVQAISEAIQEARAEVFLLEGVTGSGKTEVYLQVISQVLARQQTAVMLVPEISLTPQTVSRFKSRFGDQVAVLHSGLSEGEKYDEWRKIERQEASVVIGARSAVFAPLEKIGVIIIDEEHERTYKQEDTPKYHARDVAIWRSQYHSCPVVLGSATPSLESRARAQKAVYQQLILSQRAVSEAQLPVVEVIDMRQEALHGKVGTFSSVLLDRINHCVAKKEQVILMLNRRGYSSFLMCRDCGYVLPCPNCDISLTLHMDTRQMKCHYCGHQEAIPQRCPICTSQKIRYYGTGTQKVEEELCELLPTARVLRMDMDTTRKKGQHEALLEAFRKHEADILLGTQMIAKGLDFENVTLVGVLNADTALNLPDFRASEHTFQLLTQVSGRAGRGKKAGEVIIQTYNPDHYAIQLAKQQNYEAFYYHEMALRHRSAYPPYYFTVQVVVSHTDDHQAAKKSYQYAQCLKAQVADHTMILGPTPKSIARVNQRYYYQIIIKYKNDPALRLTLKEILNQSQSEVRHGLRVSIDTEPQHFI